MTEIVSYECHLSLFVILAFNFEKIILKVSVPLENNSIQCHHYDAKTISSTHSNYDGVKKKMHAFISSHQTSNQKLTSVSKYRNNFNLKDIISFPV